MRVICTGVNPEAVATTVGLSPDTMPRMGTATLLAPAGIVTVAGTTPAPPTRVTVVGVTASTGSPFPNTVWSTSQPSGDCPYAKLNGATLATSVSGGSEATEACTVTGTMPDAATVIETVPDAPAASAITTTACRLALQVGVTVAGTLSIAGLFEDKNTGPHGNGTGRPLGSTACNTIVGAVPGRSTPGSIVAFSDAGWVPSVSTSAVAIPGLKPLANAVMVTAPTTPIWSDSVTSYAPAGTVILAGGLRTEGAEEVTFSVSGTDIRSGSPLLLKSSAVNHAGPGPPRKKSEGPIERRIDPPTVLWAVATVVRVAADVAKPCTLASMVAAPGVFVVVTGTVTTDVPEGIDTVLGTVATEGSLDTRSTTVAVPREVASPAAPNSSR